MYSRTMKDGQNLDTPVLDYSLSFTQLIEESTIVVSRHHFYFLKKNITWSLLCKRNVSYVAVRSVKRDVMPAVYG